MDFEAGGIKFNQADIVSVTIGDIKPNAISPSHYFIFIGKAKKAVIIFRAGDYISASQITEYLDKGLSEAFELPVASATEITKLKTFLNSYNELETLDEQLRARKEFLELIKSYIEQSQEHSFLVFNIAFFETFYSLSVSTIDLYQGVSSILFSRAIKTSAFGVISCFLNEYLDFDFIKDFYNTSFIMDYGLVEYGQFNFALAIACEAERKSPGSGIKKLQKMKRSKGECEIFLNHPNISYEYGKDNVERFSHSEILNFLKFHHENKDGTGFPKGLTYSSMSKAETLLSFHDNMISFEESHYFKGDLQSFFFTNFLHLNSHPSFQGLAIEDLKRKWQEFTLWLAPNKQVA